MKNIKIIVKKVNTSVVGENIIDNITENKISKVNNLLLFCIKNKFNIIISLIVILIIIKIFKIIKLNNDLKILTIST